MKIAPVKGTRDFYPAEMAVRNWIVDGWKRASVRNGFAEYDGPIFEYLKMYQVKSGDEIAEQLFSLQDRGGRDLAVRPEITPTLARMVNQKINSLAKPIKWFSVPRLCRAERPQKGRLREFFQWNIDIIGEDSVLADAEVIFTAVDYLRQTGLTSEDVKAKISSRRLLAAVLKSIGIEQDKFDGLYALLDKKAKLPREKFDAMLAEQVPDGDKAGKITAFMELADVGDIKKVINADGGDIEAAIDELAECVDWLGKMGVGGYCVFDPSIVRGLAYYTGIVFEMHDAAGELRAICGGGRYDNLLKDFGGPPISGTGMGMGDCVLEILLRDKGFINAEVTKDSIEYYVACADKLFFEKAVAITADIRSAGCSSRFDYKCSKLGKQFKQAAELGAVKCVIVGEEINGGELVVKDMATGEQGTVRLEEFLKRLKD